MLTWDDAIKSAKLLHGYGELRPGFIQDGAASVAGPDLPPVAPEASDIACTGETTVQAGWVKFEYNERTGEVRYVVE
jgi:hypothetical protein